MPNQSYPRAERVRHAVKEVLASELERMSDPGLGLVTITDVDMSPDMRNARVFYTVYGPDPVAAATKDALKRAAGHLRTTVAREVRLRFAPRIEFEPDPIPQRAARIEGLIAQIHQDDPPSEDDEA